MKYLIALALTSIAAATPAIAQTAIGLKAGTLGVGVDLTASLPGSQTGEFDVRLNGNYFSYNRSSTYSNNRYDGDLKLNSIGVLVDWYPTRGSFRVSAGGYYVGTKLDLTGQPTGGTFNFNGSSYTAAEVGTLNGKAKFSHDVAPYVGIGWGNPVGAGKQWTFFTELGVIFTGSPKLSLSSTGGTLSSNPTFQQNLDVERQKAQDDVSNISVYPVISLGFAYKF